MSEPAFPTDASISINGKIIPQTNEGMTLRDYFAAKAMQTILMQAVDQDWNDGKVAEWSYGTADAMIEARKEPTS